MGILPQYHGLTRFLEKVLQDFGLPLNLESDVVMWSASNNLADCVQYVFVFDFRRWHLYYWLISINQNTFSTLFLRQGLISDNVSAGIYRLARKPS